MFASMEADVFWLNVTNIALGIGTAICLLAIIWAAVREIPVVLRRRRMHALMSDGHALLEPQLGLTMADGGSPNGKKRQGKSGLSGPKA